MTTRRDLMTGLGGASVIALTVRAMPAVAASLPPVTVYKSPTCGCCAKWAAHMRANGFQVTAIDRDDLDAIKQARGVPADLQSCHTAIVGGYTIEGHVPASDVMALLSTKPVAFGLAVPGMPVGSPGMEMGDRKDPYAVMIFGDKGRALFARH